MCKHLDQQIMPLVCLTGNKCRGLLRILEQASRYGNLGQAKGIIKLSIGEQPTVRRDFGAKKFQLQAAVKIAPKSVPLVLTGSARLTFRRRRRPPLLFARFAVGGGFSLTRRVSIGPANSKSALVWTKSGVNIQLW